MGRVVKKPFERRAEIIRAASQLFQTKDYDSVTMQDVMELLNIAKGTIYHYFKSKDALFEAVIEEMVAELMNQMQKIAQESDGNALDKIKRIIQEGRRFSSPELLEGLHKRGNEALHTRLLVATLMQQAPLYAKLIEEGNREGVFSAKNPLECAEFILSGVQFLTDRGIHPWSEEDLLRRAKAFPGMIENLLNAPTGSFQFMFS